MNPVQQAPPARELGPIHAGGLEFAAPWSVVLKLVTPTAALALLAAAVFVWFAVPPEVLALRALLSLVCGGTVFVTALFTVRGYRIEGRILSVQRLLWDTRISLDGLRSVVADPGALKRSLRLCGNGGLFAFTGWFRNRRLGTFRAFATDPARAVVLTFRNRTIVVTPHDPEAFVRALESRHG